MQLFVCLSFSAFFHNHVKNTNFSSKLVDSLIKHTVSNVFQ